jgi:hypothetical protein
MSNRRRSENTGVHAPSARTHAWQMGALAAMAALALLVLLGLLLRTGNTTSPLIDATTALPIDLARHHVASHPFDFVGYTALAESAAASTDTHVEAKRALVIAKQLAPLDPIVTRSEFRVAHALGDTAVAMRKASRLLDVSTLDHSDALQTLAAMSGDPLWPEFVAERLKDGWIGADTLLIYLCERRADSNRVLLLAHQIARMRPVSTPALHCVEHQLVRAGAVDTAYHLRLVASANLAKQLGYVFNGDFEQAASGSAFDWAVAQGGTYRAGFEISLRRGSDNGRSGGKLVARFNGRPVKSALAHQYLALIPGRYRIVSHSAETGFNPGEAPVWTLRCATSSSQSLELDWAEQFEDQQWVRRSATFSIGRECPGQLLSFAVTSRLKSLEGLRGTAVVDSVRIERI